MKVWLDVCIPVKTGGEEEVAARRHAMLTDKFARRRTTLACAFILALGRHPTFTGALHVFQLLWKPQHGLVTLFTLSGQEVQQRRVLTNRLCVSELQERKEIKFFSEVADPLLT